MLFLPGESIVYGTVDAEFVVTTHRIRMVATDWGQSHITSFMLEELCSAEMTYTSYPWLLLFALLSFLLGGIVTAFISFGIKEIPSTIRNIPLCFCGLISVGLIVLYFITRHHTLLLSSGGSSIALDTKRLGVQRTEELIDTIEMVKNDRFFQGQEQQVAVK